ncbi:hypothetical protein PNA2_1597 [Pyrococcus sp. NA2]|uniref:ferritin-like domain-containing protein n=1 Tax=Pyrococcus sp. (strain NA2) TaxID=342949 RepID=UPI000209A9AB|nr:ferritin family protein [Pyrococcus sp. NA2]AEC52512.1 hypothetical protein PNA2_1597 [Pyrococcus sp. NA2]
MVEEIVKHLEKFSPKEILGYAIASEDDSKKLYEALAPNFRGLLRDFFMDLAKAEEEHKKILLELHEKLFGDRNYIVPKGVRFAETSINVKTVANLIEALKIALTNEATAERIYRHLADRISESRKLLLFLATQERSHYESIKAHKEYFEAMGEGKPELISAPVEYISSQLEIPFGPQTKK